jgi:Uma2 family endonuclease
MKRPEVSPGEVLYPEADGKPMAESDIHRDLMFDLIAATRYHFREVRDVYVSGNLFIYYVEGDPRKCVAPDFFFVRGVSSGPRRTFKLWEEAAGPKVVIELTSTSTHAEDLGEKRDVYEELGVIEYFLFDPEGIRFHPQLRGYRLHDGALVPMEVRREPQGVLILSSAVMGLDLHAQGTHLRFATPESGEELPVPDDFVGRCEMAECRADLAERRAQDLARELKRLRGEP